MGSYFLNIEEVTKKNTDYRKVLYTSNYSQLVVMCIKPGDEIGNEIHGLDQFIRIEAGTAKMIVNNGKEIRKAGANDAVIIPAGNWHNVVNTGKTDLKLYTIYSPPAHLKSTLQATKADEVEDHFDGKISK